ncbi:hypothetical protein ACC827_24570 [Rhizobium ruizarguesonis]
MRRYFKAAALGFAITSTALLYFFPIWQGWVEKFQTLITGALAVLAAHYTVRQMQRSDHKTDDRHNKLMDLSLRPIRLKVSRSVFPTLPGIGRVIADVKVYIVRCSAEFTFDYESLVKLLRGIETLNVSVNRVLQDPQLMQSYELFDGNMSESFNRALDATRKLQARWDAASTDMINAGHAWQNEHEVFDITKPHIAEISVALAHLRYALQDFRDNLVAFGRAYEASYIDRPSRL